MKLRQFIPVLIIAAGIWAYHNSFSGPFIFDDLRWIPENRTIRHLWPISDVLSPTSSSLINARPVINLSLAVNYALGGYNVWGYHALNLAIHILAGLTLFGIVRRTLLQPRLRGHFGAAANGLALTTAVLWTVHPLQTESVTYVIQRAESMMGLFYLLTLYCAIRGVDSASPKAWYILSVASCLLGMATKEVMASAPLIVLLYDRAFVSGSFREAWRRRRPLYLGLSATWILQGIMVVSAGTFAHVSVTAQHASGGTRWEYLLIQPAVILYYLRLAAWPHPLCFDYYGSPSGGTALGIPLSMLVMAILLGATAWACKTNSAWGFLGAWFFLILAPTSSIIPLDSPMYEHRMYLSLAAVVTIAVVGVFEIGKRLFANQQGVALGCVAGGAVVVLFTFLTIQRNRDYNSALAIWLDTVEKRPNNSRAHNNLGLALTNAGRLDDALRQFEEASRIKPDYAEAHNNLGGTLLQMGKAQQAIGEYQQALRIAPDFAGGHFNLGLALGKAGKVREAIGHYEQAVRIQPDYAEAHFNLAIALEQTGNFAEAIKHYEQVLRIKPDSIEAQNNLAWLLATLAPEDGGNPVRGLELAKRVCELTDNRAAPYLDTLAAAYAATGQFSNAVATAEKAIDLARSSGHSQVVREIEPRLGLYRNGHGYRQSVGVIRPRNP